MEFYVFCVTFRNALFRVGTFYAFYVVAPAAAFAATGAKVGIGIGAGHACGGEARGWQVRGLPAFDVSGCPHNVGITQCGHIFINSSFDQSNIKS